MFFRAIFAGFLSKLKLKLNYEMKLDEIFFLGKMFILTHFPNGINFKSFIITCWKNYEFP